MFPLAGSRDFLIDFLGILISKKRCYTDCKIIVLIHSLSVRVKLSKQQKTSVDYTGLLNSLLEITEKSELQKEYINSVRGKEL